MREIRAGRVRAERAVGRLGFEDQVDAGTCSEVVAELIEAAEAAARDEEVARQLMAADEREQIEPGDLLAQVKLEAVAAMGAAFGAGGGRGEA